tara:strand:- start:258 stop:422 length:165 start_codon:yes stop_codon:yes gene_type:complete
MKIRKRIKAIRFIVMDLRLEASECGIPAPSLWEMVKVCWRSNLLAVAERLENIK